MALISGITGGTSGSSTKKAPSTAPKSFTTGIAEAPYRVVEEPERQSVLGGIPEGPGFVGTPPAQAYSVPSGAAEPAPPLPGGSGTGTGGGDGGGVGGPAPSPSGLQWEETYSVEGAPDWWKGLTPSQMTPQTEIATLINNMIPFMSPEDQRTAAQNLARQYPDAFGHYSPLVEDFPVPSEVPTALRQRFQSSDRAQQALEALTNMAQSINRTPDDFGPGYGFLEQILDVLQDFGGGGEFFGDAPTLEGQTRLERQQMRAALDPLLAETKGQALSSFGPLAQMLSSPFFSSEPLAPQTETIAGNVIPGRPNPRLFL